jgi:hypothetical protein
MPGEEGMTVEGKGVMERIVLGRDNARDKNLVTLKN